MTFDVLLIVAGAVILAYALSGFVHAFLVLCRDGRGRP